MLIKELNLEIVLLLPKPNIFVFDFLTTDLLWILILICTIQTDLTAVFCVHVCNPQDLEINLLCR